MAINLKDFKVSPTDLTYEGKKGNTGISGQDPITIEFSWDTKQADLIDQQNPSSDPYNLAIESVEVSKQNQSDTNVDRFNIDRVTYNYNAKKGTGKVTFKLITTEDNSPEGDSSGESKSASIKLGIKFELFRSGWTDFQYVTYNVTLKASQQVGEIKVKEGKEPEKPTSNEEASNDENFSNKKQKEETKKLKPKKGKKIKIPDWVVYNIIANKLGFYPFMSKALKGLVELPLEIAEMEVKLLPLTMNVASLWDGTSVGEGTILGSCKGVYDRQQDKLKNSKHPDQYVIKLDEPTTVTKFGYKDDKVQTWSYTTRVIEGKPREGLVNTVQTRFQINFLNLISHYKSMVTFSNIYTEDNLKKAGKIFELFYPKEGSTDCIMQIQDKEWVLILKEPWMQFIYDNLDFYTQVISELGPIRTELNTNKVLSQYNGTKPTPEQVADRVIMRPYQKGMIEARDVLGITPFNLQKSEIYMQEYYNNEVGIKLVQAFDDFVSRAEAIIDKVPQDIQDTVNSVLEPMGAIVVTAVGPGSVSTNAVQIAGQIKRTKDALHKLKTEVQEPIDLAMSIGIPPIFYSPLTVIAKLLEPF